MLKRVDRAIEVEEKERVWREPVKIRFADTHYLGASKPKKSPAAATGDA
ncbi:hypothetical protein ES705_51121 [subsurface metagenome]